MGMLQSFLLRPGLSRPGASTQERRAVSPLQAQENDRKKASQSTRQHLYPTLFKYCLL